MGIPIKRVGDIAKKIARDISRKRTEPGVSRIKQKETRGKVRMKKDFSVLQHKRSFTRYVEAFQDEHLASGESGFQGSDPIIRGLTTTGHHRHSSSGKAYKVERPRDAEILSKKEKIIVAKENPSTSQTHRQGYRAEQFFEKKIPNPDTNGRTETTRAQLIILRDQEQKLGLDPGTFSLMRMGDPHDAQTTLISRPDGVYAHTPSLRNFKEIKYARPFTTGEEKRLTYTSVDDVFWLKLGGYGSSAVRSRAKDSFPHQVWVVPRPNQPYRGGPAEDYEGYAQSISHRWGTHFSMVPVSSEGAGSRSFIDSSAVLLAPRLRAVKKIDGLVEKKKQQIARLKTRTEAAVHDTQWGLVDSFANQRTSDYGKIAEFEDDIMKLEDVKNAIEPDYFQSIKGKEIGVDGLIHKVTDDKSTWAHARAGSAEHMRLQAQSDYIKVYTGSAEHRRLQAQSQKKLKEIAKAKKDAELKAQREKQSLGNTGMLGQDRSKYETRRAELNAQREDIERGLGFFGTSSDKAKYAKSFTADDIFKDATEHLDNVGISPREFKRTFTPEDKQRSKWINRRLDDIAVEEGVDPAYVRDVIAKHGGHSKVGLRPDDPSFNANAEHSLRNVVQRIKRGEPPNEPSLGSGFSPEEIDEMTKRIDDIGKPYGINAMDVFKSLRDTPLPPKGAGQFGPNIGLPPKTLRKQKPFKDIITPRYAKFNPWGAMPKKRPMAKTVKPYKLPDPTFFARQFMQKKGVTKKHAAGYGLLTGVNITGAYLWDQSKKPRKRSPPKKKKGGRR